MDKNLLKGKAFQINNDELEKAMEMAAKEHSKENTANLFAKVKDAEVLVPVVPPKGLNPKFMQNMKGGLPLNPIILKNKEGDSMAPAYTSAEMIKNADRYPMMWKVSMKDVCRIAANFKPELKGIWLNPDSNGIILHQDFIKALMNQNAASNGKTAAPGPQTKQVRMSPQQFAVLARKSIELNILPADVFAKKAEFMADLEERKEACLLEYYKKPFNNIPCDYTEEDFSVMVLEISDTVTAACIELPNKHLAIGSATQLYIIWNPVEEEIYYYLVEKGEPGQSDVLCSVTADKTHNELMSAPATGSELNAVLELIQEEKEEQNL